MVIRFDNRIRNRFFRRITYTISLYCLDAFWAINTVKCSVEILFSACTGRWYANTGLVPGDCPKRVGRGVG